MLFRRPVAACAAFAALIPACAAAADEPAAVISAAYTADVTGVVAGRSPRAGRFLDNLDVLADVDLARVVKWPGAQLHAHLLNNSGGAPNDLVGSLQGVDNIEVASPRLRLFELWVDQSLADGRASVRAGLYDLNSEFYANEAAGLLVAPPFGIGSELAATGPNGPSIFPSTALGVRANLDLGEGAYVRAAVVNAKAGVQSAPRGVDLSFDDGVLAIAEAGREGPTRFGIGAWRYSQRQDDIRDLRPDGRPARRRGQGAYLLGEHRLAGGDEGFSATAFARIGVSDGDTTAFRGGWQAGVRLKAPFAARPDGEFSFGVQQGLLGDKHRRNLRDAGVDPSHAEDGFEITYADRLTRYVTVQPDLQYLRHAGGDADARSKWIGALRVTVELGPVP